MSNSDSSQRFLHRITACTGHSLLKVSENIRGFLGTNSQFRIWSKDDSLLRDFLSSSEYDLKGNWVKDSQRRNKSNAIFLSVMEDVDSVQRHAKLRTKLVGSLKQACTVKEPLDWANQWQDLSGYLDKSGVHFCLIKGLYYGEHGSYEFYLDYTRGRVITAHSWRY